MISKTSSAFGRKRFIRALRLPMQLPTYSDAYSIFGSNFVVIRTQYFVLPTNQLATIFELNHD